MQPLTRNGSFIGYVPDLSSDDSYETGLATLQYVGGYTTSSAGGTTTLTIPLTSLTGGLASAPAAGDLVIAAVGIAGTAAVAYKLPAAYTQLALLYANDTYDANLMVGFKLMTATPDTSFTITSGSGSTANALTVAVHVWRNADSQYPVETPGAAAVAATLANTVLPNPNGISPVTPGAQIIVAGAGAHIAGVATYTASYLSNFLTIGSNSTNDSTIGLGNVAWTSGQYDPAVWTFSAADATTYSNCSAVFAIRPAITYSTYKKNQGIWDLYSAMKAKQVGF